MRYLALDTPMDPGSCNLIINATTAERHCQTRSTDDLHTGKLSKAMGHVITSVFVDVDSKVWVSELLTGSRRQFVRCLAKTASCIRIRRLRRSLAPSLRIDVEEIDYDITIVPAPLVVMQALAV